MAHALDIVNRLAGTDFKAQAVEVAPVDQRVDDLFALSHSDQMVEIDVPGLNPDADRRGYQFSGVAYALRARRCFIGDEMGLGKSEADDELVLTPTGWVRMGDVAVGDRVIGSDGRPTEVLGVFPQGVLQTYVVTFRDGASVEVSGDHLWSVNTPVRRNRGSDPLVLTTSEILDRGLRNASGNYQWFVPMVAPVHFDSDDVPIDGYVLGALLGDGSLEHGATLHTGSPEFAREVVAAHAGEHTFRETGGTANKHGLLGLAPALRDLGLLGVTTFDKFVPKRYLHATPAQRLSVLQGLVDSDGSVDRNGHIEFSTGSSQLADDVRFLVQSLGGTAKYFLRESPQYVVGGEKRVGQPHHRLSINLPLGMQPGRIKTLPGGRKYGASRSIVSIEPYRSTECTCIRVAAEDSLYVTRDFVVTHNTPQAQMAVAADGAFPALFVVKPSLAGNWKREINFFFPDWNVEILRGRKNHALSKDVDAYIIGYAVVNDWADTLAAHGFKAIVCDESQDLKNHKSRPKKVNGVVVKDGRKTVREYTTQRVRGVKTIADAMDENSLRILLTGTAVVNRPVEFASQLDILGRLDDFGGFFKFATKYCGGTQDRFGWDFSGATNTDVLNRKMRETCYVRRLKKDVLRDLPPKSRVPAWTDMNDKVFKAYDRAFSAFQMADPEERLSMMSQIRKLTGMSKVDMAVEWIDNFFDQNQGEKLVVFAHHVDVQEALVRHYNAQWLRASMKPDDVESAKKAFMDGDANLIVCSIQAHSTGHTLTAASNMLIVEMDWVPGTMEQAEDRIHRIGQKDGATMYWLLANDTLDDIMYGSLMKKMAVVNKANNGEALTDEERHILNTSVEEMVARA